MHQVTGARRSLSPGYLCASLVIFLAGTLATAVCVESQPPIAARVDIDNFGQANENYYRGGQPDIVGFAQLKRLGIKTVIDLQEDGERDEPEWVREAGMQYFNIPLSSHRPATAKQTEYFLKLVNDQLNWPVYVHCAGGKHRTGEMTAIYRINHDAWTADRAYQEMRRYGYSSLGGHGSLRDYVYHYYSNYQPGLTKPPDTSTETSVAVR